MILKNLVSPSRRPGAHQASPAGHQALGLTTVNLVQTPCERVCFTCAPRRLRAATGQPVLTPRVSTDLEHTHTCVNDDGEVVSKAPVSEEPTDQWGAHGQLPAHSAGKSCGRLSPTRGTGPRGLSTAGSFSAPSLNHPTPEINYKNPNQNFQNF